MNVIEIIDAIRAYGAELALEEGRLVLSGRGKRLPDELKRAVREQKVEIMYALGAAREVGIADVLSEMRPFLPPALKRLPDASILALVNISMVQAWNRAAGQIRPALPVMTSSRASRGADQGFLGYADDE